jgi:hypothetical protein
LSAIRPQLADKFTDSTITIDIQQIAANKQNRQQPVDDFKLFIIRKTKCFRILERNAKISKTKRNFSRLYPTPQKFKKIDRLRRNEIHLKAVRMMF